MPKAVFPIATVIAGVINLLFAMVPLFTILLVTGHRIGLSVLFLPVSILLAALFTLGAGLLLSPLAVFFHDTIEMIGVHPDPAHVLDAGLLPHEDRARALSLGRPLQSDPLGPGGLPRPDLQQQGPADHAPQRGRRRDRPRAGVGGYVFRKSSDRIPFYV